MLTQNADDHQRWVDTTPLFISELLDLPGLPRLIEPRLQWPIKPKAQEPSLCPGCCIGDSSSILKDSLHPLHNVAISILRTPAKYSLFTKGCQYPRTKSRRQPANIRIRSKKILKLSIWVIKHKNEVRTKKIWILSLTPIGQLRNWHAQKLILTLIDKLHSS